MKRPHRYKLISIILAGLCASGISNCPAAGTPASAWPAVSKETHPWVRWWWMGNAVDEKNIGHLLETYHQAGIGGVEIAPIYGAKNYENRYIQYLSPQWMQMLGYTVKKAGSLDMGVDLTNGTGWPFGGPQVSAEIAAAKIIVQQYALEAGHSLADKLVLTDPKETYSKLLAVTAYSDDGKILLLTDKVDASGALQWTPDAGKWTLYAAFAGRTRQMVKRAAPGGEGFTLNHFSQDALQQYLGRFDQAFNNTSPKVRAFFNDSYEVYDANWSDNFFEEFQKRRGYDLRLHVRELFGKDQTSPDLARLKADYRATMAELLLENFTQPWTAWAHKYHALTRNQAHGSPGNLLDLYATVDIPECETFGSSAFDIPGLRRDKADIRDVDPDPVMLKFASSAGHVAGHNLVSSETFTWLTDHFKTSLSQTKPQVEQIFLSGVNHVFYHGTTYSPEDVQWPGWLFYASTNMVPANSFWVHLPGLNHYITRVQSVLQSGHADNEILIYWPVYDVWNNPKGMDMALKVHDTNVWLQPSTFYKDVKSLQKVGYSIDYVSDNLLRKSAVVGGQISTAANATPYKILVVPQTGVMPVATLEQMLNLARNGATVLFQELPADVPGLQQLDENRQKLKALLGTLAFEDAANGIRQTKLGKGRVLLAADIQQALAYAGLQREALTDTGLQFIRRQTTGAKFYYLVNHTANAINQEIPLNVSAASVTILDPQTGAIGLASSKAGKSSTQVRVQLQPGESLILNASEKATPAQHKWTYLDTPQPAVEVKGDWKLHFKQGGPTLPPDQTLKQLVSWTALPDKNATNFSGNADYTLSFVMPKTRADEFVLDLGEVHESAHVWVNGHDAGILWAIPFKARIGAYLKPGQPNQIRIEVANLMANRIRYMDQQGISWRNYHEINFVNIDYKDFNAAGWPPMPSGLIGPVTITGYKK
jgi:hypothetical protein